MGRAPERRRKRLHLSGGNAGSVAQVLEQRGLRPSHSDRTAGSAAQAPEQRGPRHFRSDRIVGSAARASSPLASPAAPWRQVFEGAVRVN